MFGKFTNSLFFTKVKKFAEKGVFSLLNSRKKTLLLLSLITLGTYLPLYFANAALSDLARLIVNGFFSFWFILLAYATAFGVGIATWVLNWVISDNFISFSYTQLDNPIIAVGWTLTRDLVNIAFVIILLVIGLATALRYKDYQAKKALSRLIIMALLINFSNVLCGIVVDASNILMNFFLEKVSGLTSLGNILRSQTAIVGDTIQKSGMIIGIIPTITIALVLSIFNVLVTITLLMFAGIFALRYIAIWILVILSPVAFAAWILPGTRKYFEEWSHQFTQWCIIGIVSSFFLYLGNHMLVHAPEIIGNTPPILTWEIIGAEVRNPLEAISGYVIALFFLWFGLFTAMSSSAMGSALVVKFAQKQGTKFTNWAKQRATGAVQAPIKAAKVGLGRSDRLTKFGAKMGNLKSQFTESDKDTKSTKWAKRAANAVIRTTPFGRGANIVRGTGQRVRGLKDYASGTMTAAEKSSENLDVNAILSKIRSTTNPLEQAGFIQQLAKKGDLEEAMKKAIGKKLSEEEIIRALSAANKVNAGKDIQAAVPHLVNRAGITVDSQEDRTKGFSTVADKVIASMRPDRVKNMIAEAFKDKNVIAAYLKFAKGNVMAEAAKNSPVTFVERYMKVIDNLSPDNMKAFIRQNPQAAMYLAGNAAQDLGLRSPGGMDRKQIQEIIAGSRNRTPEEINEDRKAVTKAVNETYNDRATTGDTTGPTSGQPSPGGGAGSAGGSPGGSAFTPLNVRVLGRTPKNVRVTRGTPPQNTSAQRGQKKP